MRIALLTLLAVVLPPLTALAIPTAEHGLLYENEVVACDQRLVGTWLKPDGEEDIIIRQVGEKLCSAQVVSWIWSPTFHAYLGRIEGHEALFAEFYLEGTRITPDFKKEPRIIATITLIGKDLLIIKILSDDWLYKMSKANKLDIPHEVSTQIPEHVHITASTEGLRAFILRLLEEIPEAFEIYPRYRKK